MNNQDKVGKKSMFDKTEKSPPLEKELDQDKSELVKNSPHIASQTINEVFGLLKDKTNVQASIQEMNILRSKS